MKRVRLPRMILDNALLEEEFFEEVALMGIVCAKRAHSIIWELNRTFDIHFSRDHELQVEKDELSFPVYVYEDPLKQTEHFIFSNRKENSYLLPEAKNIDYIWMIKSGSFLRNEKDRVMNGLAHVNGLQYFFEMDSATLKSRSFLII